MKCNRLLGKNYLWLEPAYDLTGNAYIRPDILIIDDAIQDVNSLKSLLNRMELVTTFSKLNSESDFFKQLCI
jgi:hypothetical protein